MANIKNIAVLVMLIIITGNSSAQQKGITQPLQFHSINIIGLLEGQAGSAFQLQTINGAQYKSWFAGAGVGLDYYRYRTIPLFFDLRKEFGTSGNKFFVYADAGINFYWKRDKDAKQFYSDDRFKNGFYWEVGAGYKVKLNQKISLLLGGGYSFKKITEEGITYSYMIVNTQSKINYNLNRLVLNAGIEF